MVILTGASASGKTEVAKLLAKKFSIIKATTTTSRLPRALEKDGVDYFFVSKERFEELVKENAFVEHTLYNGNYYGTGKSEISPSKCVVVDPNGLKSFLGLKEKDIITFFLEADEATREARMTLRGDKKEDIIKRLSNDRVSFAPDRIPETDFIISTDKVGIEEVTDDVYMKYVLLLKGRGVSFFGQK